MANGSRKARRVHVNTVLDMPFIAPSFEEQKAIGEFFKQLDSTIDFHQRTQNKYKNLKIACLEKLFSNKSHAWVQRKLGDVFIYERPDNYIVKNDKYSDKEFTPVLTANKGFLLGFTHEKRTYNQPSIIFDDFTLDSKYVDFAYMVKSSAIKILTTQQDFDLRFAFELLNSTKIETLGHARHYISVVQPTKIFVPRIEEQQAIGEFFRQLDNTIATHQRETLKLQQLKEILLKKMFV